MADRIDAGWAKEVMAAKTESRTSSFAAGHTAARFVSPAAKGLGSNPAESVLPAAKPKKRFGFL